MKKCLGVVPTEKKFYRSTDDTMIFVQQSMLKITNKKEENMLLPKWDCKKLDITKSVQEKYEKILAT